MSLAGSLGTRGPLGGERGESWGESVGHSWGLKPGPEELSFLGPSSRPFHGLGVSRPGVRLLSEVRSAQGWPALAVSVLAPGSLLQAAWVPLACRGCPDL